MEKTICSICQKPKSNLQCGLCNETVCKGCAEFIPEDTFSFLKKIPDELKHTIFCLSCYNTAVQGQLAAYNEIMQRAKDVMIFTKSQAKETRFVKRDQIPYKIKECTDHDEVIMRMAFKAVQMNFNSVIDVEVLTEKVRIGSYQTSKFAGSGMPANVILSSLVKDRSLWSTPN